MLSQLQCFHNKLSKSSQTERDPDMLQGIALSPLGPHLQQPAGQDFQWMQTQCLAAGDADSLQSNVGLHVSGSDNDKENMCCAVPAGPVTA